MFKIEMLGMVACPGLKPSQNSGELNGMRMNSIVCNHLNTINEKFFH